MNIVTDIQEWRRIRKDIKGTLGFVPTMGHLHEGHISLCRKALAENDSVVVSIFVNPTQFNQPSDFENYKRTMKEDCRLLQEAGVHHVFAPEAKAMYPDDYEVQVTETVLSRQLEGQFRPGHFPGMMTVVLKLLNIIAADKAYFGEKDYQQLLLVQKMAKALFLPVEIIPCPTIRAKSGLALSSRNGRLSPGQQEKAARLHELLESGGSDEAVKARLENEGFRPEYVATQWGRRLAAAWLGEVRLIDNVPAKETRKETRHAALS
jgi:pantoate--beta-alanine ligase